MSYIKKKKLVSHVYLAYLFFTILFQALFLEAMIEFTVFAHSVIDAFHIFFQPFLIFAWFIYDSRVKCYKPSRRFRIGMVAVPFVLFPVYIFKMYGFTLAIKMFALYALKIMAVLFLAGIFLLIFSSLGIIGGAF